MAPAALGELIDVPERKDYILITTVVIVPFMSWFDFLQYLGTPVTAAPGAEIDIPSDPSQLERGRERD